MKLRSKRVEGGIWKYYPKVDAESEDPDREIVYRGGFVFVADEVREEVFRKKDGKPYARRRFELRGPFNTFYVEVLKETEYGTEFEYVTGAYLLRPPRASGGWDLELSARRRNSAGADYWDEIELDNALPGSMTPEQIWENIDGLRNQLNVIVRLQGASNGDDSSDV